MQQSYQPISRPVPLRLQAQLVDLMAITINTSPICSVNNGPRPDRLMEFLYKMYYLNQQKKSKPNLFPNGSF